MLCFTNTNVSVKMTITTCFAVRCTEPTIALLIWQIVADLTVTDAVISKPVERLYCLEYCFYVRDGDYQSCRSCSEYVSCKDR